MSVALYISATMHHMIVIYGANVVHMYKMMISPASFSFFKILILGVLGGKGAKNDLKLPTSVRFALYLKNSISYHQDFDNDIYRCFSLFFFLNSAW